MTPRTADEPPTRSRRPDALRNRERILQAAYAVFAEAGVDAQMTDIAAAADVGVATLYRNFATKEELVNALLLEYFDRVIQVAHDAVDSPDAGQAFVRFFQWVTTLQLENRALCEFLAGRIGGTRELTDHRHRLYELLSEVSNRAQEQGYLRPDVSVTDLRTVLLATARLASSESALGQRLVRRFVGVALDGLRAPGVTPLEGPPLTITEFDKVLIRPQRDDVTSRAFKRGRRAWPVGS